MADLLAESVSVSKGYSECVFTQSSPEAQAVWKTTNKSPLFHLFLRRTFCAPTAEIFSMRVEEIKTSRFLQRKFPARPI